jgi:hypothetical protein
MGFPHTLVVESVPKVRGLGFLWLAGRGFLWRSWLLAACARLAKGGWGGHSFLRQTVAIHLPEPSLPCYMEDGAGGLYADVNVTDS